MSGGIRPSVRVPNTMPALLAATVPSAGTSLVLFFDQAVTVGSGGGGGMAATLTGGAVTLTYAGGYGTSSLTYTASRTITSDETGTIAYTQPVKGIMGYRGNVDRSSFASFTITNSSAQSSGPVTPEQDWINRSTAAGVTMAVDFTSAATVATWAFPGGGVGTANVVYDPTDGIRGKGCARIDVPASAGENVGALLLPLNNAWLNLDQQGFGPTTFWGQFRYKPGPNRFVATNGGGGAKIALLGERRGSSALSSVSHPIGEFEVGHRGYTRVLLAYRDSSNVDGQSANGFEVPFGGSDFKILNAVDNGSGTDQQRYCLYNGGNPSIGCPLLDEHEWVTIDFEITQAARGGTIGNRFKMWMTREFSSTRELLIDRTDFSLGSDSIIPQGVNGLWLLPFDTGRTSASFDTWVRYGEVIVSTAPIATPVPRALPAFTSVAAGTWTQIPATDMSATVSFNPTTPGTIGPTAIYDAWTGFAIDPRNSRVYSVGNGGHADYAGNEALRADLEAAGASWTLLRASTATGSIADAQYYGDGRPTSVHSGYGEHVDPWSNRVLRIGGSRWNSGQHTNQFDAFDLTTNDWVAAGTYPNVPGPLNNSGVILFAQTMDPRNGNIYCFGAFNAYRWNRVANTWTLLIPDSTGAGQPYGDRSMSAFDTKRNRIFVLGGNVGDHHVYTPATNGVAQVTLTGSDAATVQGTLSGGLFYVPQLDAYLMRPDIAGGTIYRIDASTFAVTQLTTSGGAGIPAGQGGGNPYTKFMYAPRLKGLVHFPRYGQNAWYYRLVA